MEQLGFRFIRERNHIAMVREGPYEAFTPQKFIKPSLKKIVVKSYPVIKAGGADTKADETTPRIVVIS